MNYRSRLSVVSISCYPTNWAELWQVNIFCTVWVTNQPLERIAYTSQVWFICENYPSCNLLSDIVSNRLCCYWASFLAKELDFQGMNQNLQKSRFANKYPDLHHRTQISKCMPTIFQDVTFSEKKSAMQGAPQHRKSDRREPLATNF